MASSLVALKLQSAFGSSGLERIGFEHGGLDVSKCIWLERARAECLRERSEQPPKNTMPLPLLPLLLLPLLLLLLPLLLLLFEHCGLEASKGIWLERARAGWFRALWH